jgi:hypothetical protein
MHSIFLMAWHPRFNIDPRHVWLPRSDAIGGCKS